MSESETKGEIHKAMVRIMGMIGAVGKDQKVTYGDGYAYRGIDDLYNALYPILCRCKVYIRTVVRKREATEKISNQKNVMTFVALTVDHLFTHEDGSSVTVRTVGEGMDTSDKATAKAMSMAMKYALVQTFAIPTAGAIDNERDNFQPAAMAHKQQAEPQQQQQRKPEPQSQGRPAEAASTPPDPEQQPKESPEGTDRSHIHDTWVKQEGKKMDGTPYTIWIIKTDKGREYSTFSDSFVSIASDCKRGKCKAEIKWERNKWGYQILDISPVQPEGGAASSGKPQRYKVTANLTNVTKRHEEREEGDFDVWGVDTDRGRFGCLDPDVGVQLEDLVKGTLGVTLFYVKESRGKKIVAVLADVPF